MRNRRLAKGRKTGGRKKGTPKTGGRKEGTLNRLTAVKRILGPILARDAREDRLFDAIGTPAYEGLLKELEQERQREWEGDA